MEKKETSYKQYGNSVTSVLWFPCCDAYCTTQKINMVMIVNQ